MPPGRQERVHRVVHHQPVATEGTTPEQLNRLAAKQAADDEAGDPVGRILVSLARPVGVRQPEAHDREIVEPAIEHRVLLGRELVNPVGVGWRDGMGLVDWQPLGPAIDRAGAHEHDQWSRGGVAQGLEQRDLGDEVVPQISLRIADAPGVRRVAHEIEHHLGLQHRRRHRVRRRDRASIEGDPHVARPRGWRGGQRSPVSSPSTTITTAPRAASRSARLLPMNPAPPRTTTRRPRHA